MKKVFSIVTVAALTVAFVNCGPSKEELAAKEQAKQDSIAQVAKADSMAKAEAEAAAAARVADSLRQVAVADSIAKASKGKKSKK